ncbi:MAG: PBP1A family penicillin-binding protein [candidate division WOR-3 bacterium]|nr:MAG: PBP1A family penicillin-binding protein [candidate division WOR-3 bacterium]
MTRTRFVLLIVGVLIAIGLASAVAAFFRLRSELPATEEIVKFTAPASTRVFDCRGRLVHEFFQEKRRPVPIDSIPRWLTDAVVAVEDRRFYTHWGIDLARIPGLIWGLVQNRGLRGTSTITQQLARSMFLTFRRRIDRKLKEMVLAVELERHYSKEEILEMYLNQIWFGGSIYGVEAAALRYFGKPVSRLDLAECATLGAMVANPARYSPHYSPELLVQRRNFFLHKLHQAGSITMEQFQTARQQKLEVNPARQDGNEAPYFVEEVRRSLLDRFGPDFVYRSGARIYTTLDLELQRAANTAVEQRLAGIEKGYGLKKSKLWYDSMAEIDTALGDPEYLQGALVAIETRTGYVRAMVGGRDFGRSEYNRATQALRQTGSAFKPFVYVAAIDNGFTAGDIMVDSTIELEVRGQPKYAPHNYDHKMLGPVTLRRALALSRNLVAVRLIARIGPELVARYANLMGVSQKLLPVYSLALGSVEVPLIEMTTAFNTLANQGVRVRPVMVTRVCDNRGLVVEENLPDVQPVVGQATAYVMASMMQSVVDEGTATVIRSIGYSGPAAGKTGTTDDYTDAWFIGFTPEICCGVWVGYDRVKTIFRGATGGGVAAPVWGEFIKAVRPDTGSSRFDVPPDIVTAPICEETGMMATSRCPRVRYEVFIAGTEPTLTCADHSGRAPSTSLPETFEPIHGTETRH